MTISEKIISVHAGKEFVEPGEFVESSVDRILANDITAPFAIEEFLKSGVKKVFDASKIVLVPDHFTPCKDIRSAETVKTLREFARIYGVRFYEIGRVGIEHALLPEGRDDGAKNLAGLSRNSLEFGIKSSYLFLLFLYGRDRKQ